MMLYTEELMQGKESHFPTIYAIYIYMVPK